MHSKGPGGGPHYNHGEQIIHKNKLIYFNSCETIKEGLVVTTGHADSHSEGINKKGEQLLYPLKLIIGLFSG